MRATMPILGWLLAGLALAGCGGGEVLSAGGVSVLVAERASGGMDALGGGVLEVVGGCLGAGGAVIVWPHGTSVADDDPLTIRIPGNGTFGIGDEVAVGGGYVLEHSSAPGETPARTPAPFEVAGVMVPADCAEHDVFLAR